MIIWLHRFFKKWRLHDLHKNWRPHVLYKTWRLHILYKKWRFHVLYTKWRLHFLKIRRNSRIVEILSPQMQGKKCFFDGYNLLEAMFWGIQHISPQDSKNMVRKVSRIIWLHLIFKCWSPIVWYQEWNLHSLIERWSHMITKYVSYKLWAITGLLNAPTHNKHLVEWYVTMDHQIGCIQNDKSFPGSYEHILLTSMLLRSYIKQYICWLTPVHWK